MASQVDMCNAALARLGQTDFITSLDDGSANAGYCKALYQPALEMVLDEHSWSFNTVTVNLSQVTNPNNLWQYAYGAPSDLIGIVALYATDAQGDVTGQPSYNAMLYPKQTIYPQYTVYDQTHGTQQDFSLEADGNGNFVLYSNTLYSMLKYSTTNINPGLFPPLFQAAFSLQLASRLAGPILKGDVGVQAARVISQEYAAMVAKAIVSDASNRKVFPNYVPAGIQSRA